MNAVCCRQRVALVSLAICRYILGMSATINARTRVPSHGVGQLVDWQPGQSGNPSGRPTGMKELRQACRKISAPGVKALERILTETVIDEQGNVHNAHEGKVVVAALQIALTWGFGKAPDYDPREDDPSVGINTAVLTAEQRKHVLAALRAGLLVDSAPAAEDAGDTAPTIEGSAESQ